jgi:hypothetical protein
MLVSPIRIAPSLPWSMGQFVVPTVLRCSPAGDVASGSAHQDEPLGGADDSVGPHRRLLLAGAAAHNPARRHGILLCLGGMPTP